MSDLQERASKKRKRSKSDSNTQACLAVDNKNQGQPSSKPFLTDKEVKQMACDQQLWLFAFPESFDITSLSKLELDIPDKSMPNSVVAKVTVNDTEFEVFENQDAENIVNIVPKANGGSHVAGLPFQRSFTIRKAINVPAVDGNAIKKKENVAQIVESAKIARTQVPKQEALSAHSLPQKQKVVEKSLVDTAKKSKSKNPKVKEEKAGIEEGRKLKKHKSREEKERRSKKKDSEKKKRKELK